VRWCGATEDHATRTFHNLEGHKAVCLEEEKKTKKRTKKR